MTYTTTLKALRKHSACIDGYNKLAYYLKDEPYRERDTYLRFRYDAPIPLSTILESNGLEDALWSLRAVERTPEFVRDCRLFAVACVQEVQHLLTDPRSLEALEVVKRHAHGLATDAELVAARDAARDAARAAALGAALGAALAAALVAALAAALVAARAAALVAAALGAAGTAAWAAAWDTAESAEAALDAAEATRQKQAELFKQFFCKE